jgi:hypothetical protein
LLFFCVAKKQKHGGKTKQGMQLLASYRATLHLRLACMPAEGGKPEAKRSKHAALPACIYRLRLAFLLRKKSSVARLLAQQSGEAKQGIFRLRLNKKLKKQGEGLLLSVRCLFRRIFSI